MFKKDNMYTNFFENKIKKSSNILAIDINIDTINLNNIIVEKKLSIKNINILQLYEEKDIYDIIILYDIFSKYSETKIKDIICKIKTILKNNGQIVFIQNLVTSSKQYYHIFSYIRHYIFEKPVYISDFFDSVKENELIVIDFDRIYNINIPTYPFEYFSLITRCKY